MKVTIDIDVSPEEARRFFGLPDVTPMQEMVMERIREQMEQGLDGTLLPNMMRSMVSGGIQSMEAWQKMFSDLVARSAASSSSSAAGSRDQDDGGRS